MCKAYMRKIHRHLLDVTLRIDSYKRNYGLKSAHVVHLLLWSLFIKYCCSGTFRKIDKFSTLENPELYPNTYRNSVYDKASISNHWALMGSNP